MDGLALKIQRVQTVVVGLRLSNGRVLKWPPGTSSKFSRNSHYLMGIVGVLSSLAVIGKSCKASSNRSNRLRASTSALYSYEVRNETVFVPRRLCSKLYLVTYKRIIHQRDALETMQINAGGASSSQAKPVMTAHHGPIHHAERRPGSTCR